MIISKDKPSCLKSAKFHIKPSCVRLEGEVNDEMATHVCSQIERLQNSVQDVIPLCITTDGGDVYSMFKIMDCMSNSTKPISTIASGMVASAGVCIFANGAPGMRYILPNTRLMIHGASTHVGEVVTVRELEVDYKELKAINDKALNTMGQRCKNRKAYFHSMLNKHGNADIYFNVDEAIKHGIADVIGQPSLETTIFVESHLIHPPKRRRQSSPGKSS